MENSRIDLGLSEYIFLVNSIVHISGLVIMVVIFAKFDLVSAILFVWWYGWPFLISWGTSLAVQKVSSGIMPLIATLAASVVSVACAVYMYFGISGGDSLFIVFGMPFVQPVIYFITLALVFVPIWLISGVVERVSVGRQG